MLEYFAHSPGTFIVDEDASYLVQKLTEGSVVKGRIVLCLGQGKYLLRIYGRNIVMRSDMEFERRQEIELTVKAVRPHLILIPTPPGKNGTLQPGKTDLVI
ncbi:MAG TPA: hypothetical protein PKV71_14175 [Calditrichia bacterium]|nr:hypothetical protein [Calditrichota bacterium]HQU70664.1 hypothetical protein [Calditrichia bacterium]HQV33027.1 hypothetical protein [Calditrichia bacterium]